MSKFDYWQSKKNNEWYWHLKANNGQVIAVGGEGYKRKEDCTHGIDLVKQEAPGASIVKIEDPN